MGSGSATALHLTLSGIESTMTSIIFFDIVMFSGGTVEKKTEERVKNSFNDSVNSGKKYKNDVDICIGFIKKYELKICSEKMND